MFFAYLKAIFSAIFSVVVIYGIVGTSLGYFADWLKDQSWVLLILLLLILGWAIKVISLLASYTYYWISKFSRPSMITDWILIVLLIINVVGTISFFWARVSVFSSKMIFINIALSLLVVNFTFESYQLMKIHGRKF